MAAAAAANPFLAMQLLGQAQQLQNLGFLAAAALQQQQQQPFFPGGFPPNPNQFAPYPGPHASFNGRGAFQPGGAGFCAAPDRPYRLMNPPGKGCNNTGDAPPAPRPMLNVGLKDRNSSGGSNGEVNHSENKADGMSDFSFESGGRNKMSDQKGRFNAGRGGRDDRQFGSPRGRGRGRNFNPGRGRGAPPIIYDANEVKQWLEARKKNYPTSVNKLCLMSQSDEQNKDEETPNATADAAVHVQELKEVLAKQQELGFELPELPPGYLSETEDRGDEKKSKWKTQHRDSRFGNRNSNTKRSRSGLISPLEFPSVKVNQIEIDNNIPPDELDDLLNAEMIKDSCLDLKENGDGKELTSVDGGTDSVDHNERGK
ncbi:hypothetical protein PR202_gb04439 [Eleusine coracana subsp. coracana]|uniref:FMR1-interacting protein 1 conserved domain-containing protein n=1 Tax=Eleusine coracana subsp. coracana TaxID=191504 RepID=A0AAV5E4K8_ELECO|nr:hypothetical protein PR202_gb04439 [Eleusine coracana subsp. coracana]